MTETQKTQAAVQSKRAFGRSLSDFKNPSAVEKRLIDCCAQGKPCVIGEGKLPEEATAANTIRAGLIRFLALGGDDKNPVHEEGVMIHGAWITGKLSLHQVTAAVRLDLRRCHFDAAPVFNDARLPQLVLSGSSVPGLRADGMTVAGDVFLRDGFSAVGEVRLLGAQIGGDLSCTKGRFRNAGGNALNADRMTVAGSVFLHDGFSAIGEVRLLGAQIGGVLSCINGRFRNTGGHALSADRMTVAGTVFLPAGFSAVGEVRLLGAQIGGDLSCTEGRFRNTGGAALSAAGMTVAGSLFLRQACIKGAVRLVAAKVGTLSDDADCWKAGGHVFDGFQYDRIIGSTDAGDRVTWLNKQREQELVTEFAPQPWEQLVKVLRETGHPGDAALVAMAKQDQWRRANASKDKPVQKGLHFLYGWLAGYGYKPLWTVGWMLAVCVLFSAAFWKGGQYGYFGPTSPLIHAAARFDSCGAPGEKGKNLWTSSDCPTPPEYTTFQPFFYSLDMILPLVDLHQEADWAPIVADANGKTLWPGRILRWMVWFEILFGWLLSLMLVAVLGRLVDKD